jgi:hypothetical protein
MVKEKLKAFLTIIKKRIWNNLTNYDMKKN